MAAVTLQVEIEEQGRARRIVGTPYVVTKSRIIGTDYVVYTAWEPDGYGAGHSTITYERFPFTGWPDLTQFGKWGRVGMERLPQALEDLPAGSDERGRRVREWQAAQYERAYNIICDAYPEARSGRRSMGEIEMVQREEA
jgi:hypothetical protein